MVNRIKPYFNKFWKYRELLLELVKRDLIVKYRRSYLGYLWSLLNPLLMMIVISAVFSYVFRYNIPNYSIYLLTGQILYTFVNEATSVSMLSLINGSALIRKVALPKYIFPLSRTLSSFVNLLFSLLAIVIMLPITHTKIRWTILLFPIPLLYILVFAIGMGLILAILAAYYRDVEHLYSVVLTAWMYFTPIFYPVDILPRYAMTLMRFNPLYHYIQMFRQIVLYGQVPELHSHLTCIGISLLFLAVGLAIFKKYQDRAVMYL